MFNMAGFTEASLLTTWTPGALGARHGRPEATRPSLTTTAGRTRPSTTEILFTAAGRRSSSPTTLVCRPPIQ